MRATWTSFTPGIGSRWIVAHRGASAHHRENSPEAFEAAIEAGADAVETDVRRTADGVFVCHHDETLHRTAGVDRAVADLTLAELRDLAPDHARPLADVLGALLGRSNLLLDLKLHSEADIAALVRLLRDDGVGDSIAIGARSLSTQAQLRRLHPGLVQLGLLGDPDEAVDFVEAGGRWVRFWQHEVTAARLDAMHGLGVPVLVMVGGDGSGRPVGEIDAAGAAALFALGVDGLMLNDPDIARDA